MNRKMFTAFLDTGCPDRWRAIESQFVANGHPSQRRRLIDLDIVGG